MPYCPKCGVEVEKYRRSCPLCSFPIPEVEEPGENPEQKEKYIQNLYRLKKEEKKRRWREARIFVYTGISFSLFILSIIFGILDHRFSGSLSWSRYVITGNMSAAVYLFFILRFIPAFLPNFTGIWLTTTLLLYLLDSFNGKISWFFDPGLIIVVNTIVWLLILRYTIRHSRRGLNIPSYILVAAGLGSLSLDGIHNLYRTGTFNLSWSVPVATALIPVGFILLFLHFLISPRIRDKIARKLHL